MKTAVISLLVMVGVALAANFETLDVDAILSNERVLNSYIKCMLSEGPCTPEGRDLRKSAPLAVETACKDCTAGQKALIRKAGLFMIKNRPKEWALIVKKYDPNDKYNEQFVKFLHGKD